MNPIDPNLTAVIGVTPDKPLHKPNADASGSSDVNGIADAAGTVVEGTADVVEGMADAAGGVLEGAGGCLDGCAGCSLAIIIALFVTAQAAFAVFR